MLTIKEIDQRIKNLQKQFSNKNDHTPIAWKRAGKELTMLNFCKIFLRTQPTQKNVEKQLTECKRKAKLIKDGFSYWRANTYIQGIDGENPLKIWSKINEEEKVKKQIKTLEYILNK